MYDVVVVGGGPIGGYTASQLADQGFEVCLFEEDDEVGKDVICTGVIGTEAFKRFSLPRTSIIREIKSITFFSPSLLTFDYTPSDTFAYVVDRGIFDSKILEWAREKGVEVHLGRQVRRIKINENLAEVGNEDSSQTVQARVLVLATGIKYQLHKTLGLKSPPAFLQGVQVETEVKDLSSTEIYVGSEVSPGSFAWAVPLDHQRARIGLLTRKRGTFYLNNFLNHRFKDRINEPNPEILQKSIAHGPVQGSVGDRILAVGEAAGQVKTTTGGGIYYGLLCSEIAVEVLKQSFHKGDLSFRQLVKYENLWKSKLGGELRAGLWARKIMGKLSDQQIDMIFKFIRKKPKVKELMERKVKFDYHSDLISFGLKLLKGFIWR
ncbi:MAG: geranylgeranyl reductase family protein [Firmicutes bacterium]|nr:geranylgeranyl reductase family protein [Bacillota bacterium]